MSNDEAIQRRGLMLVLSSPSGAGKTSISRELLRLDRGIAMSVSVTTRPMRPGETPGVDYDFIDRETFDLMRNRGDLLEWAEVFGNLYGTPRAPVDAALVEGRDILFDIDWQGTQQLAAAARSDLVSVFVLPPSMPELERRLNQRGQDPAHVVAHRMSKASEEMSHWREYDYIIVNHRLDQSVARVQSILDAERVRRDRQTGLSNFVRRMREGY